MKEKEVNESKEQNNIRPVAEQQRLDHQRKGERNGKEREREKIELNRKGKKGGSEKKASKVERTPRDH